MRPARALEAEGFDFESAWERRRRIAIDGETLRVAPLADLVRSKQIADRPKDRLFLEMYRDALGKAMRREERRRPGPE